MGTDSCNNEDIENSLRHVVLTALSKNEDITVNIARARTELELDLEPGFFKSHAYWKQHSKDIITLAFEQPDVQVHSQSTSPLPVTAPVQRNLPKPKSNGNRRANKHSRSNSPSSDGSEDESRAVAAEPIAKEDESPADSSHSERPRKKVKTRKRKAASPHAGNDRTPNKPATTKSSDRKVPADETELEIKRLQGWLMKCGIRKLWHRELAHCDSSRDKVQHLKDMLREAGMTGRYSVDKAKQIKEARELAAELEAAQEFDKKWGQKGDEAEENDDDDDGNEDDDDKGVPDSKAQTRRRPKGLVDFGDSGDESDS